MLETARAKVLPFRSHPKGHAFQCAPHNAPRYLRALVRSGALVRYLRFDADDRIVRASDLPGTPFVDPPASALVGRTLSGLQWNTGHLWKLAMEQCRAIGEPIPITYEWQHGCEWIIRTAVFVPVNKYADAYVFHRGTRPLVPEMG